MHPSLWPIRLSGCFVMQITAIQSVQYIRAVSTETQYGSAKLHFPTTTAGIPVYYSARTFKRPTHCLTTTFTSRIPGQRRLDLYFLSREILPAGNQEKYVLRINYTCWESKG